MDIKGRLDVSGSTARQDKQIEELQKQAKLSDSILDPMAKARAEKAAKDFESMLLKQMIGSMQQTVSKEGLLKSKDEETYQDMLNEALSDSIASGQGIGIKDIIMKELVKRGGRV
jgi:Rod binding domain-containing protein